MTWARLKQITGYFCTVLPYLTSAVLIFPGIPVPVKLTVLILSMLLVLFLRIWHERSAWELESIEDRQKRIDIKKFW